MQNWIKIVEALAWPIASLAIALICLAIIRILVGHTGSLSLRIKDWLNIDKKAVDFEGPKGKIVDANVSGGATADNGDQDEKSSAETIVEVKDRPEKEEEHFFFEDSAPKMERLFNKFRESDDFKEDQEFWESVYVDRRRELGIGDEEAEHKALLRSHSDWVWPYVFLIRRYVRMNDPKRGREALSEALKRTNPEKRKWVLLEGIDLNFSLFGINQALEFVREQLEAGVTDPEKREIFRKLANLTQTDDPFSGALFSEIAWMHGNDWSEQFDVAFKYGEVDEFSIIAFERYRELRENDRDRWNVSNNMGVMVSKGEGLSESLAHDFFEESIRNNSPIAHANIARNLVSSGFVARAEELLENLSDDQLSADDVATVSDARAKVAAARRKLEKEKSELFEFSRTQNKRFSALIMTAYEFFCKHGSNSIVGGFASKDKKIGLLVADDKARVALRLNDRVLSGELSKKPLCFEGLISGQGSGGLLSTIFRRILAVQVSEDEIRAVVWPRNLSEKSPLEIVQLYRTDFQTDSEVQELGKGDVTLENVQRLLEPPTSKAE